MNLNKPMKYAEFSKMSNEAQRKYLLHQMDTYGVGKIRLSKMLGIGTIKMAETMTRLQIQNRGRHKMTFEERTAFDRFLSGSDGSDPLTAEPDAPSIPEDKPSIPHADLGSGRLLFSGSVSAICNTLLNTFGKDTVMAFLTVDFQTGGTVTNEKTKETSPCLCKQRENYLC